MYPVINANKMYEFRGYTRNLFCQSIVLPGDPASPILELPTKNEKVNNVSIDLNGCVVEVTFEKDYNNSDIDNTTNYILNLISGYLNTNINQLNLNKEDNELIKVFINKGLFCDLVIVGNSAKIHM